MIDAPKADERPRWPAWIAHSLALAGYFAVSFALIRDHWGQLGTHILADNGDGLDNWWNLWWVRVALLERHQNPYFTDMLWHPTGTPLYFHSLTPINGIAAIPFQWLFGDIVAYNAMVLATYILGGWFFYLMLAWDGGRPIPAPRQSDSTRPAPTDEGPMVSHRGVAFVGGLLYTLSPYHVGHTMGHLNFITIQYVPLFVLAWREGLMRGAWWAPGAALALLATTLSDFHYFLFGGLIAVGILIDRLARVILYRSRWRRMLSFAIAFAISAAIFLGPLLWAVAWERANREYPGGHESDLYCADLLLYLVPGGWSYWGWLTEGIWSRFSGNLAENAGGLGLVTLVGVAAAFVCRSSGRWVWCILGAIFLVLSLGPQLRVAGRVTDIVLPYGWLERNVPAMAIMGTPVRLSFGVLFCASVLACLGLDAVLRRVPNVRRRTLFVALLAFAVLIEDWPRSLIVWNVKLEPEEQLAVNVIRDDPDQFAVLVAPGGILAAAKYFQTLHRKPMIGGFISRPPIELMRDIANTPLLPLFLGLRDAHPIDEPLDQTRFVLWRRNIRYLITLDPKYDVLALRLGLVLQFQGRTFSIWRVPTL